MAAPSVVRFTVTVTAMETVGPCEMEQQGAVILPAVMGAQISSSLNAQQGQTRFPDTGSMCARFSNAVHSAAELIDAHSTVNSSCWRYRSWCTQSPYLTSTVLALSLAIDIDTRFGTVLAAQFCNVRAPLWRANDSFVTRNYSPRRRDCAVDVSPSVLRWFRVSALFLSGGSYCV